MTTLPSTNGYQPYPASIITNQRESSTIFTLTTQFQNPKHHPTAFTPGQFNMLYHYGVGEVAISIAADPAETLYLSHTIRAVGRITKALQTLQPGDQIGIRGPYGQGWPVKAALGKDIIIVTGGLGCAPTVSLIQYLLARRSQYGAIKILQGVKHSDDFIFKQQYARWQKQKNTEVYIAANFASPQWPWHLGYVTDMIQQLTFDPQNTLAMMCGPEIMMQAAVKVLLTRQLPEQHIYLSMERNMVCGIGHCGHCQFGGLFICKDGPVFTYAAIKALLGQQGF